MLQILATRRDGGSHDGQGTGKDRQGPAGAGSGERVGSRASWLGGGFKYAKTALTVLLLATVAVFFTIQFRESARRMDDAQDTILMICFREENGSYALGSNSRGAIAECEKEHDAFEGGPRWRAMKANLDDWEKCITEARAQMATGNSSKFDESTRSPAAETA